MRELPIYTPGGGPPAVALPSPEIFSKMGEAQIFKMLQDFYELLGSSEIKHLFPPDLAAASQKSAAFFVGICGGPPLYHERYGPPMMRKRHMPFAIDEAARVVWLKCFNETLQSAETKYGFPLEHLDGFKKYLEDFSRWMVNVEPKSEPK